MITMQKPISLLLNIKRKDRLAQEIVGVITGSAMPGGSANRIPNKAGSNPEGSIATRFIAEAMYNELKTVDLTIQNAGGVAQIFYRAM